MHFFRIFVGTQHDAYRRVLVGERDFLGVGSGRLAAVSDTGPLIHLAEIGCLPLLTIFEELHIPEGVWIEADRPSTIRTDLTFAKRHVLAMDEIRRFTVHSAQNVGSCG